MKSKNISLSAYLRTASMVLALWSVFCFAPVCLHAQTPSTLWYTLPGPSATVFYINNADDLAGLAQLVNDGNDFSGKTIILPDVISGINLTAYGENYNNGKGWMPIGKDQDNPFNGTFNGSGKIITGLYINDGDLDYVGLFGVVRNGTVENLALENVNITGFNHVGSVAGRLENVGSRIRNCRSAGIVGGNNYIGGIVGSAHGVIDVSYSTCTVNGQDYVGGIVGYVGGNAYFRNCYSTGSVTGNRYVGGIAGRLDRTATNCYTTSFVSGNRDVGGVAGSAGPNCDIQNCAALNTGVIRLSGQNEDFGRIAGFVFEAKMTGNVAFEDMNRDEYLYSVDDAAGRGGESKTAEELQTASGFHSGFLASPWTYEPGKLPGLDAAVEMPWFLKTENIDISDASVNVEPIAYNGELLEPAVTVMLEGIQALSSKYNVSYEDNIDAGTAKVTITGKDNYFGSVSQYFTISPKDITITGFNITKVYDGNTDFAGSLGNLTFVGLVEGETADVNANDVIAEYLAASIGSHEIIFTGNFDIIVGTANAANYNVVQPTNVTGSITRMTQAPLSINFPDDKIFGDAPFDLSITGGSGDGAVSYAIVSGRATVSGNTLTITGAGDVVVRAVKAADENYEEATIEENFTIAPKPVTITGLTANNKPYNGNLTATTSGTAIIVGNISGNSLTVSAGTAEFADKNAGENIVVMFSGYSLAGTAAIHYILSEQPANVTANITARTLSGINVTANNKVYDATTEASVTSATANIVPDDDVSIIISEAEFDTKNVGNLKTVNIITWSITGADAGNYVLPVLKPTVRANITRRPITFTGITVEDKVYDGNTTATITGVAAPSENFDDEGDLTISTFFPSATFADKDAANDIDITFSGFSLAGAAASNYTLNMPTDIKANITPKELTIAGFSITKKFDGNNSVTGGFDYLRFEGLVWQESATVNTTGVTATYAQSTAGEHLITFNGNFGMTAVTAIPSNYTIVQPSGITGEITQVTSSGEIFQTNPLNAWVREGVLHVTGLTPGKDWSVYNTNGTLVHRSVAISETANIRLFPQGVYIIQSENNTIKIVCP